MSDPVITVEDLSKSYLIGHEGPRERYTSLRDTLARGAKSALRRTRDLAVGNQMVQGDTVEEFWALRDVSFEVRQGEVLGVIGRNGAGKSTLLKILSRITEPTAGRVTLNGRVASLLEVGTGFHPELTGRENIFLNGAILGMSRREIRAKFDEIVDFSGVEKFLDTPVKRYSSGMYVRLAFGVAAHLEPEILVVDEVLAVGDAEFQRKCMGKMKDVAGGGRTVLFVSHNMAAITTLTRSSVYLAQGNLIYHGDTDDCIKKYLSTEQELSSIYTAKSSPQTPHIARVEIITGTNASTHRSGDDLVIETTIEHQYPRTGLCFALTINNYNQQKVAHFWIYDPETPICRKGSTTKLRCIVPSLPLNIGNFTLSAFLADPPGGTTHDVKEFICPFQVEIIGKQTLFGWRQESCSLLIDHEWDTAPSQPR